MTSAGNRVALVTGANKGIGFAIVKGLCEQLRDQGIVYLAARDDKRGEEAIRRLKEAGLHPRFLQLDISDSKSIVKARDRLKAEHGGLDILVNNAGIAYKNDATEPFGEQAEVTVATNFTGTVEACEVLFPLLRPHARVVNVSSRAGDVEKITNSTLKKRSVSEDLTLDELKKIMKDFVSAAKQGTHKEAGFPNTAYGMSKIGLTAATRILQRDIAKLNKNEDIIVNACCPGYVDTDMTSHKGTKTITEGADTPLYLALLPPPPPPPQDGNTDHSLPRGAFVAERRILDWTRGF